jgi:hypothetical protein
MYRRLRHPSSSANVYYLIYFHCAASRPGLGAGLHFWGAAFSIPSRSKRMLCQTPLESEEPVYGVAKFGRPASCSLKRPNVIDSARPARRFEPSARLERGPQSIWYHY